MNRWWQWAVVGMVVVVVLGELAAQLPRLLPSLAWLAAIAVALRVAWYATSNRQW